jgi:hypothetical protein
MPEVSKATPPRAEAVRAERRRKPGSEAFAGIKLSVDETKIDRTNYQYRFVNDHDNRVQKLYAQDWDVAPEADAKPDSNGMGSVSSALGGTDNSGKPYNQVLMRKPKDWFEADQREKQKPLDAMDEAIRRGRTNEQNVPLRGEGVYTPNGGNTIERAS